MPAEVRVTIDIDAPPEVVFDLAMDPDRTPEWVTIVRRVEDKDDGPLEQGFHMTQRLCLRGAPFNVKWQLTKYDAPHFARWEGKGPARSKAITENRLEAIEGGTRFTYTNEFVTPFGPLGAVAGKALMGGLPEREAQASLKALKDLAEKTATVSAPMSEVTTSIDIDAAPEAVFDVALDPERLGDWVTIHRKLLSCDHGEPREGMEMKQEMALRGAPFKVSWTLVACERPTHAEWKGKGPARSKAETEYTLEALPDGGTRFGYRNAFKAPLGPLGAVASKTLVGGLPESEAIASLKRLKALMEQG